MREGGLPYQNMGNPFRGKFDALGAVLLQSGHSAPTSGLRRYFI
jgi:hypothetical protein